ncbi:hypothetical protein AJ79_06384 [Helicocarpus griseus UAMH5409]|uniref:Uncharacterized protein n=1 Tax=Helicocarpus griseus UAMH5409 TaxID=1447875 RepID=A0A2B7XDT6_9EURO|nr:hypothetical protein AJ79_06384 [Helicocarpus griseus UAMH5409]
MEDDALQFGNAGGLSLMQRLSQTERDFRDNKVRMKIFEDENEERKKKNDYMKKDTEELKVKIQIFEESWKETNTSIHGGNIRIDFMIIAEAEDLTTTVADDHKRAFSVIYEIDYTFPYKKREKLALLSDLFDIRANVKLLDAWSSEKLATVKQGIIEDCDFCIGLWKKWCEVGSSAETRPGLSGGFDFRVARARSIYKNPPFDEKR